MQLRAVLGAIGAALLFAVAVAALCSHSIDGYWEPDVIGAGMFAMVAWFLFDWSTKPAQPSPTGGATTSPAWRRPRFLVGATIFGAIMILSLIGLAMKWQVRQRSTTAAPPAAIVDPFAAAPARAIEDPAPQYANPPDWNGTSEKFLAANCDLRAPANLALMQATINEIAARSPNIRDEDLLARSAERARMHANYVHVACR